jgi:hypothetical protein
VTPLVIRASVRAQLLGLPLLRVDADVAVAPVAAAAAPPPAGDLRTARELLAHAAQTLDEANSHPAIRVRAHRP